MISKIAAGKSIVKQETDRDYRYLILDSTKIKKCIHFDYVILIKHGDLPYPKRWIRYVNFKPVKGQVVPVEDYNREDYEYIFMPEPGLSDELKSGLELIGQPIDDSNKFGEFLSQLDIIPDQLLPVVKEEINFCLKSGVEPRAIDAYEYEEQGEKVYVILDLEDNPHYIEKEVTEEFQAMQTVEAYELPTKDMHLYKVNDPSSSYSPERWFIYSYADENFPYFEEIYEIENLLPYTAFKELQVK
ncbi:hypothetical protein C2I27_03390 [Priestia megaterium]|nr:hypothetical protein C2I27_03390 [Priestia megaterium]